jgi:hypothetical protein
MRNMDHRIYRTFEEFEREELRRAESGGSSMEDEMSSLLGEREPGEGKKRRSSWDDEE